MLQPVLKSIKWFSIHHEKLKELKSSGTSIGPGLLQVLKTKEITMVMFRSWCGCILLRGCLLLADVLLLLAFKGLLDSSLNIFT